MQLGNASIIWSGFQNIGRTYTGRRRNFVGQSFGTRGYFESTVGRDEGIVRKYIKRQDDIDQRNEQLELF